MQEKYLENTLSISLPLFLYLSRYLSLSLISLLFKSSPIGDFYIFLTMIWSSLIKGRKMTEIKYVLN